MLCLTIWIVKELSLTFHGITYCTISKGSVKSKSRKHCNLTVEMLFDKHLILYTLTHILVIKSSEISQ